MKVRFSGLTFSQKSLLSSCLYILFWSLIFLGLIVDIRHGNQFMTYLIYAVFSIFKPLSGLSLSLILFFLAVFIPYFPLYFALLSYKHQENNALHAFVLLFFSMIAVMILLVSTIVLSVKVGSTWPN
jgi:hypothetical protein